MLKCAVASSQEILLMMYALEKLLEQGTVAVLSGLFECEELIKECPDLILKT
jgi:thiazole synthase ThiGH ThiG subunit